MESGEFGMLKEKKYRSNKQQLLKRKSPDYTKKINNMNALYGSSRDRSPQRQPNDRSNTKLPELPMHRKSREGAAANAHPNPIITDK